MNIIEENIEIAKIVGGEDWENVEIIKEAKIHPPSNVDNYVSINFVRVGGKTLLHRSMSTELFFAETQLDKLPENCVIQRDKSHPKWKEIDEYLYKNNRKGSSSYYGKMEGYEGIVQWNNILSYKGCRLVSLDQFYNFVITKPKIGDWGKFWDYNTNKYIISELTKVYDVDKFRYKAKNGVDFMYFKKI